MGERREKGLQEAHREMPDQRPMELMRRLGGMARKVRNVAGMPPDSMLAVYKDRITYTCLLDHEVASIHYDRRRGEIFYKGHNIQNIPLGTSHMKLLEGLKRVMAMDERALPFLEGYTATLGRFLADNKERVTK